MSKNQKKDSVSTNVIWRLLERFGSKIVTFVVSIILARKIDPTVYGTIALVTVFTAILEVFIDSGLGNALIQKKDADDLDFSSVFFFNVAMCSALYLGLFFLAPVIANFYETPTLVPIIRVLSLTLVISGVKNIQYAYISKKMMFRKFFWTHLIGTIISSVVAIVLIYTLDEKDQIWVIVVQSLVSYGINTILMWFLAGWKPKFIFSWQRLRGLISYGWKLLVAKLINTGYNKLRDLVIGKVYGTEDLAFYNKGDSFPSLLVPNITASIDGVIFPVMAEKQDDKGAIKALVKKSLQITNFIVMPMMAGMIACSTPMIEFLLTEKWLPCVPYLCMFCIVYSFVPFSIANLNAIRALGRSDMILKLEIIERVFSITLLIFAIKYGVFWIGISYVVGELFSAAACAYPNKKLISYGILSQLWDLVPLMIISTVMGISVSFIQLLGLPAILTLCIQVPIGILIYLALSWIFKLEGFMYFYDIIKRKLRKS